MRWAVEAVRNPSTLRLHTTKEVTDRTIVTCPPAVPPAPLDRLLTLPDVRALDLHRYRCRVNLRPGTNAIAVGEAVEESLLTAWGAPEPLPPQEEPRAFPSGGRGHGWWQRAGRWPGAKEWPWPCSTSRGWSKWCWDGGWRWCVSGGCSAGRRFNAMWFGR